MTWAPWAVIPLFVVLLATPGFLKERHRERQKRRLLRDGPGSGRRLRLAEIVGDRDGFGTWPGVPPLAGAPVVHQTPEHDVPPVTDCCSVPMADLPPGAVFSHDEQDVTCGGRQP